MEAPVLWMFSQPTRMVPGCCKLFPSLQSGEWLTEGTPSQGQELQELSITLCCQRSEMKTEAAVLLCCARMNNSQVNFVLHIS